MVAAVSKTGCRRAGRAFGVEWLMGASAALSVRAAMGNQKGNFPNARYLKGLRHS
jgi:hypothetical protein